MQKRKTTLLQGALFCTLMAVSCAGVAHAAPSSFEQSSNPLTNNLVADAAQTECAILPKSVCGAPNDGTANGKTFKLLTWALKLLFGIVGVAAVCGMIWAGFLYLTAGDNSTQTKNAKTIIVDVVIGILLFGLLFLIINWLVPGGVFTS